MPSGARCDMWVCCRHHRVAVVRKTAPVQGAICTTRPPLLQGSGRVRAILARRPYPGAVMGAEHMSRRVFVKSAMAGAAEA